MREALMIWFLLLAVMSIVYVVGYEVGRGRR